MTDADSFLERRVAEIDAEGATVPLTYEDLRGEAAEHLPGGTFDYVDEGAGLDETVEANRRAFDRWGIRPRVLRDTSDRDPRVRLFERSVPAPLVVAPVGRHERFHDEGELATARAAASLDVPFTLGTFASRSIESVAEALGDAPGLFQLYWLNDHEVTMSLVERADTAGYEAIVLTVDTAGVPRWRPRSLTRSGDDSGPTPRLANLHTDPVIGERFGDHPETVEAALADSSAVSIRQDVRWDDLAELRDATDLPLYLKGVLHPDDARRAIQGGVDGIVVSTHGGRAFDGGIGALEALPEVVAAVDGRIPVWFDSGIRSGADTVKAIALGADAVLLGRPVVYGLAVAGERGVYEVLANHVAELESVMALSGVASMEDLDDGLLVESTPRA